MKSQTYKLLFLTFLLLNGSIYYVTLLKDIVLNKDSKIIAPSAYVQSFSTEISERITCKSNFTVPRGGCLKFNDQKVIIDGKIIRNLTPLFSS